MTDERENETMVLVPISLLKLASRAAFYAGTTNDYEICRSGHLLEKALVEWQNGPAGRIL